jgi:hypothetical protein
VALDEVEALLADPTNTAKLDGAKAMGGDDPMMMMMMVMPVRATPYPLRVPLRPNLAGSRIFISIKTRQRGFGACACRWRCRS